MVPAFAICSTPSSRRSRPTYILTREVKKGQETVCRANEPLNVHQAKKLRDLYTKGLFSGLGNKIEVEMPMPFAPFIVVSAWLSVVWSGSLIGPIIVLLQKWVS